MDCSDATLPEYLYSIAPDGLVVDMYAPSDVEWKTGGKSLKASTKTDFPFRPDVRIRLSAAKPVRAALHIRVPSWATSPMPISVNGRIAATGKPGGYVRIARNWSDGDSITFTLPVGFRMTRYTGEERIPGRERYALEYGPVLMALVGPAGDTKEEELKLRPEELIDKLRPIAGKPLHFAVDGAPGLTYLPYWEVQDEVFTCYPVVGLPSPSGRVAGGEGAVGENNLALASKGATAASDGEYANEPGCTAKAIDGIVATTGDFSNRWHSSLETPHPHWVEVKLPKPEKVGRIAIRFADPAGHPTSFQGIAWVDGKQKVLFDVPHCEDWRGYEAKIAPLTTDRVRLVIRASANPGYPNAAQVSEIEIYPPGRR